MQVLSLLGGASRFAGGRKWAFFMSGERRKSKKTAGERKFQPPTEMEKRLFLVRRTEKIEKIGRRAEKRYKAETDGHFFKSRAKIRKSFKHTICTF